MYKIIGADGKEYGPITADQLRQWLREGRVNSQTKVLPESGTEWKTLGEIPELATTLPLSPSAFQPAPAYTGEDVANKVKGPAIFILVLAILDIVTAIFGIIWIGLGNTLMSLPNMPQQDAQMIEMQKKMMTIFSLPANIAGLLIAIVCLIGAIRMMKLKNYGLAMTAAILILIPCGTCCCLANIGAGIWALVVLSKSEVKNAFS